MKTIKVQSINKVGKGRKEDKVSQVMREFSDGKLKDSHGKNVTDKNQAIAIAMNAAGLSNKSLQKAEIKNKLRMYRSVLNNILKKELMDDKSIKAEIIKLFKQDKPIADSDVHALADKLQISPDKMEEQIYNILRSFLSGGMSQGKIEDVNPDELAMGIKIESEHTDDPILQEKIARDHLAEDKNYYSKLKKIETPAEKSGAPAMAPVPIQKPLPAIQEPIRPSMDMEAEELAKELPGDIPREAEELFAKIYASCRKGGGDRIQCSQLAWSEVRNSGFSK